MYSPLNPQYWLREEKRPNKSMYLVREETEAGLAVTKSWLAECVCDDAWMVILARSSFSETDLSVRKKLAGFVRLGFP